MTERRAIRKADKKVLEGVRKHSPLLAFAEEFDMSPGEVKDSIIDLLSPYFTNHEILRRFAIDVLPPEAVNVSKILADPWAREMFVTVLNDYRGAFASNTDACLESFANWENEIQTGLSEYWSAFHLEVGKQDLSLEEFKYETFRNIGMLIEASLQPFLRNLLEQVRIRRRQPTTHQTLRRMELGLVVGELIDTSGYPELFSPPPWNIRLNQWRNMAQHHKSRIDDGKIVGVYGRASNERRISLTRQELFLVVRRVFSVFSLVKTARAIFLIDNIEKYQPKIASLGIPATRKEGGILHLAATFATQGFELIDISINDDVVEGVVKDVAGNLTAERIIHSSQFVVPLWVEFQAMRSVIKLEDCKGNLLLTATAEGKACDEVSLGVLPIEEFAKRVAFTLSDDGKLYFSR